MQWILVNIGCIECGVSSNIVGVFTDILEAEAHQQRLEGSHSWREGGQNSFEIFEMPAADTINEEYRA